MPPGDTTSQVNDEDIAFERRLLDRLSKELQQASAGD